MWQMKNTPNGGYFEIQIQVYVRLIWSCNSNTLATWCKELIHLKRPWCWERLKAGGEGDYGVWDGWMASSTQWTWVWVNSGSWWWTGRPGVLQSMGLQRVRHNWATKLNRRLKSPTYFYCSSFSFFCSAKKKDIRWKLQLLKLELVEKKSFLRSDTIRAVSESPGKLKKSLRSINSKILSLHTQ